MSAITQPTSQTAPSIVNYVNYTKVTKMVVASAVSSEGDQLYPRKWNHDFIGIPILRRDEQHRPTITEAALVEVLADTTPRYSILFALLAGTGLRIGEALALKTANLSPDCRVIRVRHTIWAGREQPPKTPNAVREVDEKTGWIMDFADIKAAFEPLHDQLDHHYLNEIDGLENATSENLARWIWERLEGRLQGLYRITIRETCTTRCDYYGE